MVNKYNNSSLTFPLVFISCSATETEEFGRRFASSLQVGDVVALVGELGTGKTVFTRGIVSRYTKDYDILVSSPSFTLIHEYPTDIPIFHLDLFRLETDDVIDLGLDDIITNKSITIVEWAEKMPYLPHMFWLIEFTWLDENRRSVSISRHIESD